jgi:hypothetical protein
MKAHTREFKIVAKPVNNTFCRFRDPNPSTTLLVVDPKGVDWIINIQGEHPAEKAIAMEVGQHIGVFGRFYESEVVNHEGRYIRRCGASGQVKSITRFTPTKSTGFGVKRAVKRYMGRGNINLRHGWSVA